MKILIGSDGKTLDSLVSKRFGHSAYFLMYDTENEELKIYDNTEEEHDHKNLTIFIEAGVTVFIVGNIGPHAFEKINYGNTKIYLARSLSVREALKKLANNELKQLTEPTAKRSIGHKH
jgi:predicted Fe-Mo cluster-binding NifX family protein